MRMNNATKELLTAREAATVLGVSYWVLLRLIREAGLPARRVGRRVWIPRRGLEAWLDGGNAPERSRCRGEEGGPDA